jgi:hypothetical protein
LFLRTEHGVDYGRYQHRVLQNLGCPMENIIPIGVELLKLGKIIVQLGRTSLILFLNIFETLFSSLKIVPCLLPFGG